MKRGGETKQGGAVAGRMVTYCLVPADLADRLHEPLREHFAKLPDVEVIVERRGSERRGGEERRAAEAEPPRSGERRKTRGPDGRRAGERRAATVALDPLPLPRKARRDEKRIGFFERREPVTRDAEDRSTSRLIARFQAGDSVAFDTLYSRYFNRVFAYLRIALNQREDAEDATQDVFTSVFEALPRFEQRGRPFQAWLFTIVRNTAFSYLRKQGRVELMDAEELEQHQLRQEEEQQTEQAEQADESLDIVDWITDRDLLVFVERLPLVARQVLVMRYLLDLSSAEAGKVLGRSPDDVRMIQHRAVAFLRARLSAVRKPSTGRGRAPSRAPLRQSLVLRGRRFSLISWK